MNSALQRALYAVAIPLACLQAGAATSQAAAVPVGSGSWTAPDNDVGQPTNTGDVTSNDGKTDKVLTITVGGQPKDEVFVLEIFDTESGDLLDTVEFSEGNAPPVTMPAGSSARVRDDQDTNSQKPRGRYRLT